MDVFTCRYDTHYLQQKMATMKTEDRWFLRQESAMTGSKRDDEL